MQFKHTLNTAGDGYWSGTAKSVKTTELKLGYEDDDGNFGELRVYFDKRTWNCGLHGLIYTDKKFMKELRAALVKAGFSKAAAADVDYSEQGMQDERYVSCDVTGPFLRAWKLQQDKLYKMVKTYKPVDRVAA